MKFVVTTNRTDLRIRMAPHRDARIVGSLQPGTEVEVDLAHSEPPWMRIADRRWVHGHFLRRPGEAPPPVRHLLVFFGGYQEPCVRTSTTSASGGMPSGAPRVVQFWTMISGNPITRNDPRPPHRERSSFTAYRQLRTMFAEPSQSFAMDPALKNDNDNGAVRQGLAHIAEHADAQGMLVLYGFSAGGFNALRLAERMARDQPQRQVNLLVTVDACLQLLGPQSEHFEVRTPSSALRHMNFFQRGDEFKGRSMPALGAANVQLDGVGHDGMPLRTLAEVRTAIADTLGLTQAADAAG